VVIDAGFQFSEQNTPGIDFMIPDVSYLEQNKEKIRGLFITHGHYDHIGAIPYIMARIGNPPIYTREFGAAVIKKRQTEFPDTPKLNVRIFRRNDKLKVSKNFTIETFDISHAIPDSVGIIVGTPLGEIVFISDIRVDHIDSLPTKKEVETYNIFKDRDVLLFTLDSTGIEKPGFNVPESKAIETVAGIMKNVPGRLVIATFASQIDRVVEFIAAAEKLQKKVIIDGRSMKANIEIAKELGILSLKNVIPMEQMGDYPDHKIVVIATGAQGEEYSVLDRVVNEKHRFIKLKESDTVILSSSVIPGNEYPITKLKDNLFRTPAKIITYREEEVHASGHGARGELKWIHEQINYKYFMPVHGNHYMLKMHKEMAVEELGVPKDNVVVPDNGSLVEIDKDKHITIRKEVAPAEIIMVDGFSVGDQQEVVIRDRQMLAEDGFVVIVATVNTRNGKLRKSPDIISRGFIYLRDNQELLDQTRLIIKKSVESAIQGQNPINFEYVKKEVTDDVRKFLFQQTAKNPIVIPVILGV
jgi:ribonuclease J